MDTTVAKAMRVLEFLSREKVPVRLSHIASSLELQKSNVHRLLNTFAELGYVTQEDDTGRYKLTLRIWEMGAAVIAEHPAKRAAMPYMQELHKATSETVSLTILDGTEVLYIDKIISPRPLRFTTQPASRAPAPLTASGKAMLAYSPNAQDIVREVIKTEPQAKHLKLKPFMAMLDDVRKSGYALSQSEWTAGVVSIAAPIMGRDGHAAAALSVSGPEERFTGDKLEANIEAILNACARIAEMVGKI